ncbi:MAG: bactofilin [Coriobacteriia bacterium]|nr:bactofilin [Coriobacteriia bacterium]
MSDNNAQPDVKIAGDGTVAAGTYGVVRIAGNGTLTGDVTCTELLIAGAGTCQGALVVDTLTVNGSGTFRRSVRAGAMAVNGDASIAEGLGVTTLKVRGRTSIGAGLAARDVDIRGEIAVGGDFDAERFAGEGMFKVAGLLNAGTIDFRIGAQCNAREIGGESIVIAQSRQVLDFWSLFGDKRLTVDEVEGDSVSLEFTTAKVVRGANVRIGEGCRIDLVEYTGELTQDPGAVVTAANKVAQVG